MCTTYTKHLLRWKIIDAQLLKCLAYDKYTYSYRLVFGTKIVNDIFWSHLDSIKLFNIFPIVLIMNSTYKTNKYGLHLF
jgi:uncharacterized membrane protein